MLTRQKRIAVLYAGGTVGMVGGGDERSGDGRSDNHGGYRPGRVLPDTLRGLIQRHARLRQHHWDIHTLNPLLDSANAGPAHWYDLAARLWQSQRTSSAACDAVVNAAVILHGTDTMDYACALLAFLMQGWPGPLVFTGAQHPLGVAGGDAEQNLHDALSCALDPCALDACVLPQADQPPVILCMGGQRLCGTRIVKMGLDSVQGFQAPHGRAAEKARSKPALRTADGQTVLAALHNGEAARVGVLRLYPGMPADVLTWMGERHPHGLVLQTYGSGTGPTDSDEFCAALAQVSERFVRQGAAVVAVSQCPHAALDLRTYAAGRGLLHAGVMSGGNMTTAAAFAKLHWLCGLRRLGQGPVDVTALQTWLETPLVGEVG